MNLNRIHHGIVSLIEPIPTGASELQKISILERGGIRIGNTIAKILRSYLQGAPMNWDPWILKDDDRYLMFYLQGLEGQTPWWSFSHLCGAVSKDLYHWDDLGILLAPSDQPWESGRISAGHTLKENGTYHLFYSAGGKEGRELKSEGIGLATSTDGIHWERQSEHFPLIPSDDDPYYGRCNWTKHFHWRDPYIFKDPKSGQYYMFNCASSKTPGNFQGCVGLAVSDTIDGNYQLLPPVVVAPPETAEDWGFYHLERPQVIYRNNQYHLFFSCFRMFQNQKWLHKHPRGRITNSSLHWYVSDRVTGPFVPVEYNQSIVPGSETSGLYGTNLLETSNPDEYIAYGWYHRLHVLEVSPRYRVRWTGDSYEMKLANYRQIERTSGKVRSVSESIP